MPYLLKLWKSISLNCFLWNFEGYKVIYWRKMHLVNRMHKIASLMGHTFWTKHNFQDKISFVKDTKCRKIIDMNREVLNCTWLNGAVNNKKKNMLYSKMLWLTQSKSYVYIYYQKNWVTSQNKNLAYVIHKLSWHLQIMALCQKTKLNIWVLFLRGYLKFLKNCMGRRQDTIHTYKILTDTVTYRPTRPRTMEFMPAFFQKAGIQHSSGSLQLMQYAGWTAEFVMVQSSSILLSQAFFVF